MSLTIAAVEVLGKEIAGVVRRFVNKNDDAVFKSWEDAKDDWLIELVATLPGVRARLEHVEKSQERLNERLASPEFQRLLDNVSIEASREPIDERRRLLAHLGAGTFDFTLMSVAEASRCERVIRELDPEDIFSLRRVNTWREVQADSARDHLDALFASGCIADLPGDVPGETVRRRRTRTGDLVVQITATYERKQ